jgi:hypothetical protein
VLLNPVRDPVSEKKWTHDWRPREAALAVFEMGCVENESPAILRIAEDRFGSGDHLLVED